MSPPPSFPLTPDEIDDLIYSSRTDDLEGLKEQIESLINAKDRLPDSSSTKAAILAAAIDYDQTDGTGSKSSLLHYASANGHLTVVEYLLSLLRESSAGETQREINDEEGTEKTSPTQSYSQASLRIINHSNVSGNTPLHWASLNGHLPVVQALVHAGADAKIKNSAGRDCIVEAELAAAEGSGDRAEKARECVLWMLKECEGIDGAEGDDTEKENDSQVNGDKKDGEA